MTYFMGIDGGGTNLRVAIIDADVNLQLEVHGGSANPNLIGRDAAAQHIQSVMREALAQIPDIEGVGIGIAGASAEYASDWLQQTIRAVLPSVQIAAASDNEIALVGALGERQGVLILSGTGSGVFGINPAGEKLQVGGWGYLLGDEGSGYWIGLQALKIVTALYDRGESSVFGNAILDALGVQTGRGVIEAVYLADKLVPQVATLAPVVLQLADNNDPTAQKIVQEAANHLYQQTTIVLKRLKMTSPKIAFAGSIIANDTPVSRHLCAKLGLEQLPVARYRPVIGAALLAKLQRG